MTTTWTLPRESVEWVGPVTVTGGGAVTLALVPKGTRPTGWTAPTILDGGSGYLIPGNLTPGTYRLWARVAGNPESVVFDNVADVHIT